MAREGSISRSVTPQRRRAKDGFMVGLWTLAVGCSSTEAWT